jgi:CRP/FNR family transcriptional regulator, cyclic AMP receptor protein
MGKFTSFLLETDLFFNLTLQQAEMIDSLCEEKSFREGEIIFPENSHGKELYLIFKGQVDIFVNPGMVAVEQQASLKPESIAILMRGQSFGEMALVDEGARSAGARAAARETVLLRIERERLLTLCRNYPEMGYKVMQNLAFEMSQKIRSADLKIREVLLHRTRHPGPA